MKTIFKTAICITLILSMLLFGACSNDKDNNQSADSTETNSKEESTVTSSKDGSSEETSQEDSKEVSLSDDVSEDNSSEQPSETDASVVGTWYAEGYSFVFREDNTGLYCVDGQFIQIGWTVTGDRLTVIADGSDASLPVNEKYTLSDDGAKLTIGSTVLSSTHVTEQKPDDNAEIVGTWYCYGMYGEEITTFNSDGTGSITTLGVAMDMTWTITNGVLKMNLDMGDVLSTAVVVDSFKIEGDKLTIVSEGVEEVFTKTRKELGGNAALCGTWIEQNAPLDEYGDPDYKYSIEFSSDGTGIYTLTEDYSSVYFIWQEKNGKIIMDVYELDETTYEEKHVTTVNVSFTMNADATTLTLNDGKKETAFDFYEEEYDFNFGEDVDLEHPLGGDDKLAGNWEMNQYGELIKITITKDGSFKFDDSDAYDVTISWYVEDGSIMVYMESMGMAIPMISGNYKVENDLLTIENKGEYAVLARKGSGKSSYCVYVYSTNEDYIDNDITETFKEADGSEYVEISYINGVKDCKFVKYSYNNGYTASTTLHNVRPLSETEYFVAKTTIDRDISLRGITFTSPNGDTVYLVITYNEDEASYNFVEVYPNP